MSNKGKSKKDQGSAFNTKKNVGSLLKMATALSTVLIAGGLGVNDAKAGYRFGTNETNSNQRLNEIDTDQRNVIPGRQNDNDDNAQYRFGTNKNVTNRYVKKTGIDKKNKISDSQNDNYAAKVNSFDSRDTLYEPDDEEERVTLRRKDSSNSPSVNYTDQTARNAEELNGNQNNLMNSFETNSTSPILPTVLNEENSELKTQALKYTLNQQLEEKGEFYNADEDDDEYDYEAMGKEDNMTDEQIKLANDRLAEERQAIEQENINAIEQENINAIEQENINAIDTIKLAVYNAISDLASAGNDQITHSPVEALRKIGSALESAVTSIAYKDWLKQVEAEKAIINQISSKNIYLSVENKLNRIQKDKDEIIAKFFKIKHKFGVNSKKQDAYINESVEALKEANDSLLKFRNDNNPTGSDLIELKKAWRSLEILIDYCKVEISSAINRFGSDEPKYYSEKENESTRRYFQAIDSIWSTSLPDVAQKISSCLNHTQ